MTQTKLDFSLQKYKKEQKQVLWMLRQNPAVYEHFLDLTEELQEELLNFCMGNRGLKITYDPFFKAIFNPELHPERLSRLLSAILNEPVSVKRVLPGESIRLSAEGSLLIMDILVELKTGELMNVEMQKIGYSFPGERGSCYSSDLVLRQYSRVKRQKKKKFSYHDLKRVVTIVLMEKSGSEFHKDEHHYLHHSKQVFDTNLNLNLLQEYVFIPLDIFLDNYHGNHQNIDKELDAWLLFLISDDPSDISHLVEVYPWMKDLYADIFEFQQHPEELITMYSKALAIMDRNTVQYMIEEQKKELEAKDKELDKANQDLAALKKQVAELEKLIPNDKS